MQGLDGMTFRCDVGDNRYNRLRVGLNKVPARDSMVHYSGTHHHAPNRTPSGPIVRCAGRAFLIMKK